MARARVMEKRGRRFVVEVVTRVENKEVFQGKFLILALDEKTLAEGKYGVEGKATGNGREKDE